MPEPPPPEPVELSRELVVEYLARNGLKHRSHESGALLVAIPAAGDAPPLQGVIVWQGKGWPLVVAQVRDGETLQGADWPAAMVRCNSWNSRIRLPKVSLQITGDEGALVVEGALPDGSWLTGEVVGKFLDSVFQGARTFWMAAVRNS